VFLSLLSDKFCPMGITTEKGSGLCNGRLVPTPALGPRLSVPAGGLLDTATLLGVEPILSLDTWRHLDVGFRPLEPRGDGAGVDDKGAALAAHVGQSGGGDTGDHAAAIPRVESLERSSKNRWS
jgi:hypothetical protein